MERKEYRTVELEVTAMDAEDLLSGRYSDEIRERMEKTVLAEAPIRRSLLYKRVIISFGLSKVGSRLLALFDTVASSLSFPVTEDSDGESVFHSGNDEDFYRPTPDSSVRYSYQIPQSEAASALVAIIEGSGKNSWTRTELMEAFALEMGWERKGNAIKELYDRALSDPRIRRSGNGRIMK